MSKSRACLLGLFVLAVAPVRAMADELRVHAAGAVQHAVLATQSAFETASGHKLRFQFGTVGALRDRVIAGEESDVVMLSLAGLEALEQKSLATKDGRVVLGVTGPAIAYRAGAAKPDISTPEALKAALLAAKSVAYGDPAKGATAGTHFAKVLGELGIAEAMRPKSHLVAFGVDGIERVAKGESELAISQATEIVANPGVGLAGALPPPYRIGTPYGASVVATSKNRAAAAAYLRYLGSTEVLAKFRANGFAEP